MLILIADSPESYQQWLRLLQHMTGTVVDDIGKEYAASNAMQTFLHYCANVLVLSVDEHCCLTLNFAALHI